MTENAGNATSVGSIQLDLKISKDSVAGEIRKLNSMFSGNDVTKGLRDSLDSFNKGISTSIENFSKSINDFIKNDLEKMNKSIKDAVNSLDAIKNPPKVEIMEPEVSTKATEKSFINPFIKMRTFMKDTVTKMGEDQKNFAQVGTISNEKVAQSANKMNAEYEKASAKIAEIRSELAKLFAEQDNIAKTFQDMPAFSGMSKEASTEQMLKANPRYNELSAQIDKLSAKLDPLVEKNRILADEIKNVGAAASSASKQIDTVGGSSKKAGKDIDKVSKKTKTFGDVMKRTGKQSGGFASMISRSLMTILRRLFVYNLILKVIRSLMSYMGGALKTNREFVSSLNSVKTNLRVAFQPIFDFILPALNALMQAVARVTAYIAAAISALFGKSYKQSYGAAKGIETAKKAMDGYGGAAKKAGEEARGALAPFDEINQLDISSEDSSGGSGGAGDFEMEMPDLSTIDMTGIERFKEIMADLLKPFKLAWENEGQATIDAAKYALESIKGLIGAIAKSWMEVWTNGTGQAIIESTLRILQLIFNIIGDIANAFRIAWETNDLGTQLLQSIADAFLNILGLIETIGNSFREVWNNGTGVEITINILEILKNIFDIVGNIALAFKNAWESNEVGTRIIQGILDVFNIVLDTIERITGSTAEWAKTLDFTPLLNSIDTLLQALAPLTKSIGDGLAWFWENVLLPIAGWVIQDAVPVFLEMLSESIRISSVTIEALKPLGLWLWENFLKPLGEWTGGVIVSVLEGIRDALKGIGDWIMNHQGAVQTMAIIVGSFATAWGLVNIAIGAWNIIGGIATGVTAAFGAAVAFLTSPIGIVIAIIGALIAAIVLLWKNWDWIVEKVKWVAEKIVEFFAWLYDVLVGHSIIPDLVDEVTEWFSNLGKWVGEKVKALVDAVIKFFTDLWDNVKKKTEETWNALTSFLSNTWESIKTAVTNTWNAIKEFIATTWEAIKTKISEVWSGLTAFLDTTWNNIKTKASTIFNNIKDTISNIFNSIKTTATNIWNSITSGLSNAFNSIYNNAVNIFNRMKDFIRGITDSIRGFFTGMVNGVIKALNTMINGLNTLKVDIPDWVPKIGGGSLGFNIPNIPYLAKGGIVDQPTLAMVGERGKEAVLPLENNTGWMSTLASVIANAIMASMQSGGSGGSGDDVVQAIFNLDGTVFARAIIPLIDSELQRMGYKTIFRTT